MLVVKFIETKYYDLLMLKFFLMIEFLDNDLSTAHLQEVLTGTKYLDEHRYLDFIKKSPQRIQLIKRKKGRDEFDIFESVIDTICFKVDTGLISLEQLHGILFGYNCFILYGSIVSDINLN